MNYPVTRESFLKSFDMNNPDIDEIFVSFVDDVCKLMNIAYESGLADGKKGNTKWVKSLIWLGRDLEGWLSSKEQKIVLKEVPDGFADATAGTKK